MRDVTLSRVIRESGKHHGGPSVDNKRPFSSKKTRIGFPSECEATENTRRFSRDDRFTVFKGKNCRNTFQARCEAISCKRNENINLKRAESIKKSSSLVSLASQRRKAQDLRDQSRRNDEIEPNRLEKRYQSMANDLKAASSRDLMERKRIVGKSSGYPEPMHFGKRQLETEKPDRVDLNSLGCVDHNN